MLLNVLVGHSLDAKGASKGDVLGLDLHESRGSSDLASGLELPAPQDALSSFRLRTTVKVECSLLVQEGGEAGLYDGE
jgi:hypothetical protein